MRSWEAVPRRAADFLRSLENCHKQQELADVLGTARQHVGNELPKAVLYTMALVRMAGADAAEAIGAAIHEGLRQHWQEPVRPDLTEDRPPAPTVRTVGHRLAGCQ